MHTLKEEFIQTLEDVAFRWTKLISRCTHPMLDVLSPLLMFFAISRRRFLEEYKTWLMVPRISKVNVT